MDELVCSIERKEKKRKGHCSRAKMGWMNLFVVLLGLSWEGNSTHRTMPRWPSLPDVGKYDFRRNGGEVVFDTP